MSDKSHHKRAHEEEKNDSNKKAHHSSSSSSQEEESSIIEKGHVYFFYRPKVEIEEVKSFDDVQRLYVLLCPTNTKDDSSVGGAEPSETSKRKRAGLPNRLLTIPKKKLPKADTHAKFWGFVSKVDFDIKKIHELLDEEHYSTATRGERTVGPCRPAGEGFYSLIHHHSHSRSHTHLVYVLEVPDHLGEVQKAFNIEKEGSMVLSVKNPKAPAPEDKPHLKEKAHLSKEEQKEMAGKAWSSAEPHFLDHEGAELVIIGASRDLVEEFGPTGKTVESAEAKDVERCRNVRVKLYDELKLFDTTQHKIKPLVTGVWQ